MKLINIAIAGQAESGKTSVARIIKEALKEKGFNVSFLDDENPYHKETKKPDVLDARRLSDVEIKIVTAQTSRSQLLG